MQTTTTVPASPAAPTGSVSPASIGLAFFGVLTIVIGLFFLQPLLAILHDVGWKIHFIHLTKYFPQILLAVPFVILGAGSIRGQRWARALLIGLAWWTVWQGAHKAQFLARLLLFKEGYAESFWNMAQANHVAFWSWRGLELYWPGMGPILLGLFAVVWIVFYSRAAVKAECEARHPRRSWTDACPLPVLVVCCFLVTILLASIIQVGATAYVWDMDGRIPLDLKIVHGLGFVSLLLFVAAVWPLYRMWRIGWWFLFVAVALGLCLFFYSDVVVNMTARGQAMTEAFHATPVAPALRRSGLLGEGLILFLELAYVFYLRRFFWKEERTP